MALKRWGASVDFIRCSTSPFHPFVGFLFKSPVKNLTWNLEEIRLLKHLRKRVDGPSNTCSPKARLAVGAVQFVAFSGWWFWLGNHHPGNLHQSPATVGVQRLVSPKTMAAKTSKTSRSGIKYKADSLTKPGSFPFPKEKCRPYEGMLFSGISWWFINL